MGWTLDDPKDVRRFETGATRDTEHGKPDYEAFFSPLVLRRRAEYMHARRVQADGSMREGDNWQKGIPLVSYAKSAFRHFMDWWTIHRGYIAVDRTGEVVDVENAICALIFNAEGYLHEILKAKAESA